VNFPFRPYWTPNRGWWGSHAVGALSPLPRHLTLADVTDNLPPGLFAAQIWSPLTFISVRFLMMVLCRGLLKAGRAYEMTLHPPSFRAAHNPFAPRPLPPTFLWYSMAFPRLLQTILQLPGAALLFWSRFDFTPTPLRHLSRPAVPSHSPTDCYFAKRFLRPARCPFAVVRVFLTMVTARHLTSGTMFVGPCLCPSPPPPSELLDPPTTSPTLVVLFSFQSWALSRLSFFSPGQDGLQASHSSNIFSKP